MATWASNSSTALFGANCGSTRFGTSSPTDGSGGGGGSGFGSSGRLVLSESLRYVPDARYGWAAPSSSSSSGGRISGPLPLPASGGSGGASGNGAGAIGVRSAHAVVSIASSPASVGETVAAYLCIHAMHVPHT